MASKRQDRVKSLLVLPNANARVERETGLGYFVAHGTTGGTAYAVLSDGTALPLQRDDEHYDVEDLLAGKPLPARKDGKVQLGSAMPNRASAAATLAALKISPAYLSAAGAFPLIASVTLPAKTRLHRFIQSANDARFQQGQLLKGTYLTTPLELVHANSGFAAVGRFALPMPVPACHVLEYELQARTVVKMGTVAPLFGQSGGGVEVCLQSSRPAVLRSSKLIPAY